MCPSVAAAIALLAGCGAELAENCMIIEGALGGTWDDRPGAPPSIGACAYAFVCQY